MVWVCFAVHFSQPKMSQNLYCVPLVAHHEWESFVPMKFFLYQLVQKKRIPSNPSNPLKNWAGRFENDQINASGDKPEALAGEGASMQAGMCVARGRETRRR